MITGVGVDIEGVDEIKKSCGDKKFLELVYTKEEKKYCMKKSRPHLSFAGKFCAKEAVIKATGEKLSLRDVETRSISGGGLRVYVKGRLRQDIRLSISHTDEYAIAFAVSQKA